ncbi:hypothetical protein K469DRAFT_798258 [Zopfia rhizophila CBS 207.26]|uniref:Uncharacterized protein n=1 Tax=Zopfia rhizophila CBS 207.26 TaxID=1314779 RepID=A0A6A6DML9_9PEZI|nr:hypothetical protein K469DRAFT_798258 [Zopfia rhizophila CBS 207.26]
MLISQLIKSTPSSDHFQSLPPLEEAHSRFISQSGDDLVANVFRPFFLEHGVERRFGLLMLHRHFKLQLGEKLVHYGPCATPWKEIDSMPEATPIVWGVFRGRPHALEYKYSKGVTSDLSPNDLHFMDGFHQLQVEQGVDGMFGLCKYPGDDFEGSCEITQGRANVNLAPKNYSEDLIAIDTTWFFEEGLWKRGYRCTCNAAAENHPHGTHVITMQG